MDCSFKYKTALCAQILSVIISKSKAEFYL